MTEPKRKFIENFDLTKLVENPNNPRTIGREGEKKLDASLDEFGMLEPIVVNKRDDGTLMIVGGHQRWKRLIARGETKGLIALVQLTDVAEKKLTLMLNGHHGAWDGNKLEVYLTELGNEQVDLTSLGLDGVVPFEQILSNMAVAAEAQERESGNTQEPSGPVEVNPDEFKLKHRCPRCSFEFDKSTTADGSREYGSNKHPRGLVVEDEAAPPKPAKAKKNTKAPQIEEDDDA